MADDCAKEDINLDSVVNLESTFQSEGTQASAQPSARAGHSEGRGVGWTAGSTLSTELNFYRGSATALISLSETYGAADVPQRALATAKTLKETAESVLLHQVGNDPSLDMEAHTEQLRALFKAMMAQAGLIVRYDKRPSRLADLDF